MIILKYIDKIAMPLSWLSIILYFCEVNTGSNNSLESGMYIFLYLERFIASIFACEYFVRLYEDYYYPDNTKDIGIGNSYCLSFLGIIDLVAWLPFLIGFFVPANLLGLIRTLRILRLLKLFRYSLNLQLIALGFYRAFPMLKSLMFGMFVTSMFTTALLHYIEPETFNLLDAFWFSYTTSTTIGYGDLSPTTLAGKIVTMLFLYGPGVAIFAAMIGVIGTSFSSVIQDQFDGKNPTKNFMLSSKNL